MKHAREWWVERVEELNQGASAKAIAQREGVQIRTLQGWKSKLKRLTTQDSESGMRGPKFLPVVVQESRQGRDTCRAGDERPLEVSVEIGAVRVVARGAIRPEFLEALLAAARAW